MRSSVGPSESGWTKSMIERPTTSSTSRAPTHSMPGAVRVDDAAALVHDDAVGAQVDEPAVTVDQLADVRLDEWRSLMSTTTPAQPTIFPSWRTWRARTKKCCTSPVVLSSRCWSS